MKFCEKGFGGRATNKQKQLSGGHAGKLFWAFVGTNALLATLVIVSYRAGYVFVFPTRITLPSKTCLYKYLHHSLHKKSISVKEMIKFFAVLCMRNFIPNGTFRHIQSLEFIGP